MPKNLGTYTLTFTVSERDALVEAIEDYLRRWPNEDNHTALESAHQKFELAPAHRVEDPVEHE